MRKERRKTKKTLLFVVAVVILFAVIRIALYSGLVVREYKITSGKVTGEHTYILIADLHSTLFGEEQEDLISLIERYSPTLFSWRETSPTKRGILPRYAYFLKKQ